MSPTLAVGRDAGVVTAAARRTPAPLLAQRLRIRAEMKATQPWGIAIATIHYSLKQRPAWPFAPLTTCGDVGIVQRHHARMLALTGGRLTRGDVEPVSPVLRWRTMQIRMEDRDSDLSILVYLVVLAVMFAGFVYGLASLLNPRSIPNPGLAAYKPPIGTSLVIARPHDPPAIDMVAIENAAVLVATEANASTAYAKATPTEAAPDAKPDPKPKRTAQTSTRKRVTVERTATARPFEERRPSWGDSWGFAQQRPASPFGGRWF